MNENRNNRHPADLLPGEQALSGLYGARREPQPPAHLDDAILAAARREVRAGPQRRRREWLLPTSLAASILLATGIMLYLEFQPVETDNFEVASVAPPAEVGRLAMRDHNTPAMLAQEDVGAEARIADDEVAALALPAKSAEITLARERRAAAPAAPAAEGGLAAPAMSTTHAYTDSPRTWLVRVQELIRDGQLDEARRELDALRKRYPDFESADLVEVRKRLRNVTPAR